MLPMWLQTVYFRGRGNSSQLIEEIGGQGSKNLSDEWKAPGRMETS